MHAERGSVVGIQPLSTPLQARTITTVLCIRVESSACNGAVDVTRKIAQHCATGKLAVPACLAHAQHQESRQKSEEDTAHQADVKGGLETTLSKTIDQFHPTKSCHCVAIIRCDRHAFDSSAGMSVCRYNGTFRVRYLVGGFFFQRRRRATPFCSWVIICGRVSEPW